MSKQFIEQQQELARKKYPFSFKNMGTVKAPDVDKIIADTITNTGKELMGLAEGEREQDKCEEEKDCPWCGRDMYCRDREEEIGNNRAVDTIKQHITNITGVEDT